jgi:diguanylate cyclase (GGDEF)-like protein
MLMFSTIIAKIKDWRDRSTPTEIREDLDRLRYEQFQKHYPALYLALIAIAVTAAGAGFTISITETGAATGHFKPITEFGAPGGLIAFCFWRLYALKKRQSQLRTTEEMKRHVRNAQFLAPIVMAFTSAWGISAYYQLGSDYSSYVALFLCLITISAACTFGTHRFIAFITLSMGLLPICVPLLISGTMLNYLAVGAILIVGLFQLGVFLQWHTQLVERLVIASKFDRLANTDALTGLPNRRAFMEAAEAGLSNVKRGGYFAIGLLDLNGFKAVNDSLGHHIGDALLQEVAARLSTAARSDYIVARLGGDEFAFLFNSEINAERLQYKCNEIMLALVQRVSIEGHPICIAAGLGAAMWPQDGNDVNSLLRAADAILYKQKASSQNDRRPEKPKARKAVSLTKATARLI